MPSQNAGAADWGVGVTAVMLVIPSAMSEGLTPTHSTQPPDQKENRLPMEEIWKSHLTFLLTRR